MIFLCDVDGIVADFDSQARKYQRMVRDTNENKPLGATIYEGLTEVETQALSRMVRATGWCISIPLLPGAKEGIELLETIPGLEVIFVTAPMDHTHRFWMSERAEWLSIHFPGRKWIFTKHKQFVRGDVFLDDHILNVQKWKDANPDKLSLFWNTFNKPTTLREVKSWKEIHGLIRKR